LRGEGAGSGTRFKAPHTHEKKREASVGLNNPRLIANKGGDVINWEERKKDTKERSPRGGGNTSGGRFKESRELSGEKEKRLGPPPV